MKKLLLLLVFLLLITNVNAQSLELNYNIEYGKVLVEYKFFNNPILNLKLPSDFSALSLYIDNHQSTPEIIDNLLKLPQAQEIELTYLTKNPLEYSGTNTFFLADLKLPNIKSNIKLILPENAILSKPIDQGSVFPSSAQISTDGQHIILEWNTILYQDKSFSIFVIFKEKKTYLWLLIPFIIAIIILVYFLRKKPKIKKIKKIIKQPVKLKPEEQRIINILKKKKGTCEQATLRLITNHPKATLSRILKELEQRNIIKKIYKGKKNIIILK